ncbi:GNAT family N-acetyltransferase [Aquimarina sp. 2201CG14-23]|uniref:GNAT family N-acetyltransferase n=1 Tax=Aquimarina mycalae TaxID=3040073 RepID=UPI002477F785|nr:GNAT family N-acetyltransferase [Aquimarina sp. 2201CG14-23]MDH7447798.1 GNAT family N-acetyltransferase [Aquimarina sp. 2201CG14-23]
MIILNDKVSLRKVEEEDHRELLRLMRNIYPPVYSHLWLDRGTEYINRLYSKNNLIKELKDPDSFYYLINYEKESIGILRIIINEQIPDILDNSMVKLQRIYLSDKTQGKGIGTKILNWVEEEFCKSEKKTIWLEVMDTQHQTIKFYEKAGFSKKTKFQFDSDLMYKKYRGMYRMIKACK